MARAAIARWRYKPTSGKARSYVHFMSVSVPVFIVFICACLYLEAAWTFITDKNAISHATIYERLGQPTRLIVGFAMLAVFLFVRKYPAHVALIIVLMACFLRGYDSIHLGSVAALTIYIPFLIAGVPPIFRAMRRR